MASGVPDPQAPVTRTRWAWLVATAGGIGYAPRRLGPGTWASAATVLVWWLVASQSPWLGHWVVALTLLTLVIALGVPAATAVEVEGGRHDPSYIVIDEVAGQLIALIAIPLDWKSLLASLILFRAFDILKPPPCRRLERFSGGMGVMLDDMAAGVYALAVGQALFHFRVLG